MLNETFSNCDIKLRSSKNVGQKHSYFGFFYTLFLGITLPSLYTGIVFCQLVFAEFLELECKTSAKARWQGRQVISLPCQALSQKVHRNNLKLPITITYSYTAGQLVITKRKRKTAESISPSKLVLQTPIYHILEQTSHLNA